MPKVSDAHVEARRGQILEAACKCLMEKGFHRTTIRDICRESGLSAGAIYGYFRSKDEILEALGELGRRNTRALFESAGAGGSRGDALARMLTTAIGYLSSPQSAASVRLDLRLWAEGLDTPRIRELFGRALASACEPFAEEVRAGRQASRLHPGLDPQATARVLLAICLGLVVQRALDPDADLRGCAEVVTALLDGTFATGGTPDERAG